MNMLKKIRAERGLTVAQAAILIGMTKSLLSQIEGGHRTVPAEKARAMAKLYRVPVESIFEPTRFTPRMLQVESEAR